MVKMNVNLFFFSSLAFVHTCFGTDNGCPTDYTGCPSDCSTLWSNYGGRKFCGCEEDIYCADTNCQSSYHRRLLRNNRRRGKQNSGYRDGCSECQNGYFKRDYASACISCQQVFGNGCSECNDFVGCSQCSDGYHAVIDNNCGDYSSVNFYYCQPDTCDDDSTSDDDSEYIENTLDHMPFWLYGRGQVGSREVGITADRLLRGNTAIAHRESDRFPIPCTSAISIWENYLDYQIAVPTHYNVAHVNNTPNNDIGETIEYQDIYLNDYLISQTLNIRDFDNGIIQMKGNVTNIYNNNNEEEDELFKHFYVTIQYYNDSHIDPATLTITPNEACMVVMDYDYQFYDLINSTIRKNIIDITKDYSIWTMKWLYNYALDKTAINLNGSGIINVPVEWMYNYFITFNNTEYVLLADVGSLIMLQDDLRYFTINDGAAPFYIWKSEASNGSLYEGNDDIYVFEYTYNNPQTFLLLASRYTFYFSKINETYSKIFNQITIVPKYSWYADSARSTYQSVIDNALAVFPSLLRNSYLEDIGEE